MGIITEYRKRLGSLSDELLVQEWQMRNEWDRMSGYAGEDSPAIDPTERLWAVEHEMAVRFMMCPREQDASSCVDRLMEEAEKFPDAVEEGNWRYAKYLYDLCVAVAGLMDISPSVRKHLFGYKAGDGGWRDGIFSRHGLDRTYHALPPGERMGFHLAVPAEMGGAGGCSIGKGGK